MRAALALLAVLAAGCREQAPQPHVSKAPVAQPAAPQPNNVSAVQVATPAEMAATKLALDPEGLRLFHTVSGASRLIAFGAARADVQRTISAVSKAAPVEQEDSPDCGAAFARWPDGLNVWFQDGKFSGWSVGPDSAALATASGLRPGSTRAELEAAYSAKIAQSTLGVEFSAGALGGLLDGPGPRAHVSRLWAGTTCLAR
ncbi:MAG TPA: hypothetical protein VFT05_01725 [Burkholderiaceae bacterium]|nr:hypothetical protein [Burkholderiaceae bacterium]